MSPSLSVAVCGNLRQLQNSAKAKNLHKFN